MMTQNLSDRRTDGLNDEVQDLLELLSATNNVSNGYLLTEWKTEGIARVGIRH